MNIFKYRFKVNFKRTSLGIFFTSFYGYLPYLASFFLISNNIEKINFKKRLLNTTFFLLSILISSYLITLNINIFRLIGLIILNLILYSIIFSKTVNSLNIQFLTNRLFYIHSIIIIFAFFSPRLNTLLSGSDEETNRVGGLVGYDYMAFFYCTYLFSEFRCLKYKINKVFIFKVLLSSFFIIISGRFGILILLYFFAYIFLRKINFAKIFSIILLFCSLIILFSEQISYLIASYKGFISYLIDNNSSDLKELSSNDTDAGYYSASPITWANMFVKPFANYNSYWLPSKLELTVDPGPSYLILNIGFIFTIFLYSYFSNFFKIGTKIFWPLFFVYILSDIKFHGILVPACMFWLYLNIYKIKSFEDTNVNI